MFNKALLLICHRSAYFPGLQISREAADWRSPVGAAYPSRRSVCFLEVSPFFCCCSFCYSHVCSRAQGVFDRGRICGRAGRNVPKAGLDSRLLAEPWTTPFGCYFKLAMFPGLLRSVWSSCLLGLCLNGGLGIPQLLRSLSLLFLAYESRIVLLAL